MLLEEAPELVWNRLQQSSVDKVTEHESNDFPASKITLKNPKILTT